MSARERENGSERERDGGGGEDFSDIMKVELGAREREIGVFVWRGGGRGEGVE